VKTLNDKPSAKTLPVSAVIATKDRAAILGRTLDSLRAQSVVIAEIVVVDGSKDDQTQQECLLQAALFGTVGGTLIYERASKLGAAAQRNQGCLSATHPVLWFLDDDILLEPDCVKRLWQALHSDAMMGGVNAMITNQRYVKPGRASLWMIRLLSGHNGPYAGKIIGPCINFLPEDREDLPEVVTTDWLNTTCTLYRREALPSPPFGYHFTGYSMYEDVTLSATVGKKWKLANARTARIFHDTQPGSHKSDPVDLARMAFVNRHYVARHVLNLDGIGYVLSVIGWELFQIVASLASNQGRCGIVPVLKGKLNGLFEVLKTKGNHE
jgi:glycosyltransferase involved in cell wall biosynthesis